MTRGARALGAVLVVLGVFWVGRETDHGLTALWEHWWCPLPLVAVVVGTIALLAGRLARSP